MSDFHTGHPLFGELDRLQRQMSSMFNTFPASIRTNRRDAFPQINIASSDEAIEVVAFAPGVDAASLDVTVDKGLLIISGERKAQAAVDGDSRTYAKERFAGNFRRVIELPKNADADKVEARYVDGVLTVTVGKREASKPRAIAIQ